MYLSYSAILKDNQLNWLGEQPQDNDVQVIVTVLPKKSYANGDFNFDLEMMKKAVEAPVVDVPKFESDEDFLKWFDNLTDDDFKEQNQ